MRDLQAGDYGLVAETFVLFLPEEAEPLEVAEKLFSYLFEKFTRGGKPIPKPLVQELVNQITTKGWINQKDFVKTMEDYFKTRPLQVPDTMVLITGAMAIWMSENPRKVNGKEKSIAAIETIQWINDLLKRYAPSRYDGTINSLWRHSGEHFDQRVITTLYRKLLATNNPIHVPLGEGLVKRIGLTRLLRRYLGISTNSA